MQSIHKCLELNFLCHMAVPSGNVMLWALWGILLILGSLRWLWDKPVVYEAEKSLKCYGSNSGQRTLEIHPWANTCTCSMLLKCRSEEAVNINYKFWQRIWLWYLWTPWESSWNKGFHSHYTHSISCFY